mmetsp:Transcript_7728/g.15098  ORF Transcript_7728/g.15098 Transcript_7728/m.15098 type:complete len:248 (-) Transcript_7728:231-974(-)
MEEHARLLMEVAVARLCEDVGFSCALSSTVETLTDVARRYIEELGEKASIRAESARRTIPNTVDLAEAFSDLGVTWRDLRLFYRETIDLKFPHAVPEPVPRAPLLCQPNLPPQEKKKSDEDADENKHNGDEGGDEKQHMDEEGEDDDEEGSEERKRKRRRKPDHIPAFLPKFPDEHTYKRTDDFPERGSARELKQLKVKENSQIERSLTNLATEKDQARDEVAARNYLEPAISATKSETKHWGSAQL